MTIVDPANGIKAIQTRYAGCHFRSRLEARWAVFFDALEIEWEYEPQGFEGAFGQPYLPDFLLPGIRPSARSSRMGDVDLPYLGTFVEVKGSDQSLRVDAHKIGAAIEYRATPVAHGLLVLGPVPDVTSTDIAEVAHSFLSWHKGVDHSLAMFEWMGAGSAPTDPIHGRAALGGNAVGKMRASLTPSRVAGYHYDDNTSETIPGSTTVKPFLFGRRGNAATTRPHPRIIAAYTAARSARFEHGQSGAA